MGKKYAFVKYTKKGQLIPGSLVVTEGYPKETANGVWEEVPVNLFCCDPITTTTTTIPPPSLRMLFSNIGEVNVIIGDLTNVTNWNTYFDLPTFGSPFTSVSLVGSEVNLYGGSNIIIKQSLFDQADQLGTYLLEIDDQANSVIEVGNNAFGSNDNTGCPNLTTVNMPSVTTIQDYGFYNLPSLVTLSIPNLVTGGFECFVDCILLTSVSFPNLTTCGFGFLNGCLGLTTISLPVCTNLGGTIGNDDVFNNIIGNTITLTVASALMTIDSGNPDGDIAYLQANNTVTIVTV